jgi:hypothetical protein
MTFKTSVEKIKAKHGDKQGTDLKLILCCRVSTDAKTKENVSLELRFVNSNPAAEGAAAELNSSVELYQCREEGVLPMIPLGLKETKILDLTETFRGLIKSHFF